MIMKHLLRFLTIALGVAAIASCYQPPVELGPKDEEIAINQNSFELGCEESVNTIEISANCAWNITKEDSEGKPIDWIKVDRIAGKGDLLVSVRVLANNNAEPREGVLNVKGEKVTAFMTISQEGNPNPTPEQDLKPDPNLDPEQGGSGGGETPGPGGDDDPIDENALLLSFDFSTCPAGWPTVDNRTHVSGGSPYTYVLNDVSYEFILGDCLDGSADRVFWNPAENRQCLVLNAVHRYLGLPAIASYALTKVSFVHATPPSSSGARQFGVCSAIVNSTDTKPTVTGGEPVDMTEQGATYEFDLTGTVANTVYYLACYAKGGGLSKLDLTYTKVDE